MSRTLYPSRPTAPSRDGATLTAGHCFYVVGLAGGFLILALLARHGRLTYLNLSVELPILRASIHVRRIAGLLGRFGEAPVWDLVCLFVGVTYVALRGRSTILLLPGAVILTEVCTISVKVVVGTFPLSFRELGNYLAIDGFPSGHVARVVVAIGVVGLLAVGPTGHPFRFTVPAVLGGLAMGWARIVTHAHVPSDVLGALVLGLLLLELIHLGRRITLHSKQTNQGLALGPQPNGRPT